MSSQTGLQIIITHILPNISRSKVDKTMKFGQLIEYNIFFLRNHTQNLMEKLLPDPFIKDQNYAYLWINSLKCHKFVFIVCPSQGLLKYN